MADLTRKTENLYNKNGTDTSNGFVNRAYLNTTGEVGDSANHTISEYIDISAFEQITISGVGATTASLTDVFYNANHEKVSYFVVDVVPKTVNVPSNAKYIRLTVANSRKDTLMLNEGSIALPYEPYGWVHSLRKQCSATETIQSGDTIYANGQPISTYSIKGNTVQNGTPTPSNPVSVNGVGERTENLYNIATVVENTFIKANMTGSPLGSEISNSDWSCSDYIEVSPNTEYTVQYPIYVYAAAAGLVFFTSKSVSSAIEGVTTATQGSKTYTFTTPNNCNYVRFSWGNSKGNETMFVTGGTAKTYEPYGYKIPITTLQGSAYVYLNEPLCKIDDYADTINSDGTVTRRIKKINLGDKNYTITSSGNFYTQLGDGVIVGNSQVAPALCTDFKVVSANVYASTEYSLCAAINALSQVSINKTGYEGMTEAEFKAAMNGKYLYYALATPTTEQITLPSIPTTDGANSITVDTTVQPSEFTATWTGWHDSSVQEYDGTDWQ